MPFAITQSCCSDASCVSVCPVNCIHPTPDEPDFGTTEMLYIDPRSCIDCGACADACPVDAITPVDLLTGPDTVFADLNRDHFGDRAPDDGWSEPRFPASLANHAADLRVAVVGTGPAAAYTASALLTTSARVTMLDRLEVPGGLIRFGVAPDHQSTKAIGARFSTVFRHPRLRMLLGVEVGTDLTHADLLAQHDAVVYAVGATSDRRLGVPGEDLGGSLPARTFVGWYNAHPEIPADHVDLAVATGRAVVVGNGNVALDMARILLTDPARLADTEIAGHALAELRRSTVTEVVVVARRGPGDAAYSLSELRALLAREDVDVVVDGGPDVLGEIDDAPAGSPAAALQGLPVTSVDWSLPPTTRRRLVLRFHTVVERIDGPGRVESVTYQLAQWLEVLEVLDRVHPVGLVLRSVGYRSEPLADLPFDHVAHTVPHEAGRVVDPATGRPVPATYVVGWVKRGPSGGIGSNRTDAAETVGSLVEDANARRLSAGRGSDRGLDRLLRRRDGASRLVGTRG